MKDGHQASVVERRKQPDGSWKVDGKPELKPYQAYPMGFGSAHALAFSAMTTPTQKEEDLTLVSEHEDDSGLESDDSALEDLRRNDPKYWKPKLSTEKCVPLGGDKRRRVS